ncbi:restriction endonuclease subunit S [Candidatus Pelagibacter sp.]|nr:restriction endonuclease subunit S [Candidatus Pelagibacter sp.]
MTDFTKYKIDELCEFTNGFSFKSGDYVDKSEETLEVFRMGYIARGGGFKEDNTPVFVPKNYDSDLSKHLLKKDDILIAMTDMKNNVAILANTARIKDDNRFVLNQRVGRLRVKNESLLDPTFFYFYSNFKPHVEYLRNRANSGVQVNLSTSSIKEAEILIPPLLEQKAIAFVLGALDDKIENNHKMNETLEEMARTIFKSWFVDFDPVHVKVSGNAPAHMDKETAALFPNSFGNDGLPAGWKKKNLSDIFNFTMGQSPPGDTYNEEKKGIPFWQGRRDFGFRFPSNRVYCTAPTRFADEGDTLISVRAPVGDVNRALERCCIGRGVAALMHKLKLGCYTYYTALQLREQFKVYEASGTVFGSINKTELGQLKIVESDNKIEAVFENFISSIDSKILNNHLEIQTLVSLRDMLLPKLMSGEIRVKDAEREVEASI